MKGSTRFGIIVALTLGLFLGTGCLADENDPAGLNAILKKVLDGKPKHLQLMEEVIKKSGAYGMLEAKLQSQLGDFKNLYEADHSELSGDSWVVALNFTRILLHTLLSDPTHAKDADALITELDQLLTDLLKTICDYKDPKEIDIEEQHMMFCKDYDKPPTQLYDAKATEHIIGSVGGIG